MTKQSPRVEEFDGSESLFKTRRTSEGANIPIYTFKAYYERQANDEKNSESLEKKSMEVRFSAREHEKENFIVFSFNTIDDRS